MKKKMLKKLLERRKKQRKKRKKPKLNLLKLPLQQNQQHLKVLLKERKSKSNLSWM